VDRWPKAMRTAAGDLLLTLLCRLLKDTSRE
jgi:hypothetical protein